MEVKDTSGWLYLNHHNDALYRTVDCEVSVYNEEDYSAFAPENKLAYIGCSMSMYPSIGSQDCRYFDKDTGAYGGTCWSLKQDSTVLVGHNIKYDIHWMMRHGFFRDGGIRHIKGQTPPPFRLHHELHDIPYLWDTQLAAYLLSAQQLKMISLDNLAKIYKFPVKPETIKNYWEKGIVTHDIPWPVLQEYLTHDIETTSAIFREQLKEVKSRSKAFQYMFQSQMNMLRMVILMEWNGLCLDTPKCLDMRDKLEIKATDLRSRLNSLLFESGPHRYFPIEAEGQINPVSTHTASHILYGFPTLKYVVREPMGHYKNGKPKFKNSVKFVPAVLASRERDLGSVDEATLEAIDITRLPPWKGEYVRGLMEYRKINKLLSTYVAKLPTFLRSPADSLIHHDLNQCVTNTGRLSSSNPNMQNRPPEVAELFKSRHDDGGHILSIDFSQVEILALAQECRDDALLTDLNAGKDIHYETGCLAFPSWVSKPPSAEERRGVKTIIFGIIYGGSNTSIAIQTGKPRNIVALIRDSLFTKYPGIERWQEENIDRIARQAKVLPGQFHEGGIQKKFATYNSMTGRSYYFEDQISPDWLQRKTGEATSLSPTQIKDYPIQGLATADWVPCIIPPMWEYVRSQISGYAALPINTTHDDLEIDVHLNGFVSVNVMAEAIQAWANSWLSDEFPKMWKEWTGTELLVPLRVKVKEVS